MNKPSKAFWKQYLALGKSDPEFVDTLIRLERLTMLKWVRKEIDTAIKRETK